MSSQPLQKPMAWCDRWNQPTVKQLTSDLSARHHKLYQQLLDQLSELDDVQLSTEWFGVGWNWAIVATKTLPTAKQGAEICYVVPNPETPLVCVPLSDQMVAELPMRKLHRYLREGVKAAKCALSTHWASWTPISQAEVGHVMDMVGRKLNDPELGQTKKAG